jgi:hypothetical protein
MEEEQQMEIEALQAIYGDDFQGILDKLHFIKYHH